MNVRTVQILLALAGLFGGLIEVFVSLAYWGQTWIFNERLTVLPVDRPELVIYQPLYGILLFSLGLLGVMFAVAALAGRPWGWWIGIFLYPLNIFFGVVYWMMFADFRGFTFLSVSGVVMSIVITVVLVTDIGHMALGREHPIERRKATTDV
jgi:hypothetical protein